MSAKELVPFQSHDHISCIQKALQDAEATCARLGLRLTSLRRKVFQIIWGRHTPIKAYEILHELHQQNPKTAPPTVYRALDFLLQAGLVHRIESFNAYVGCSGPGQPHEGYFLICNVCGVVAEIEDANIGQALDRCTKKLGFQPNFQLLEIQGCCSGCAS